VFDPEDDAELSLSDGSLIQRSRSSLAVIRVVHIHAACVGGSLYEILRREAAEKSAQTE